MKNKVVFLFCFLAGMSLFAQKDSIVNSLEEVIVLADKHSKENSIGYKIIHVNDSVILQSPASFTSLLRYNTSIYLREYGGGGTSSARFRGTGSSNTAVVWNGVNINSLNNGQTGFNSLSVNLMDDIDIRSGGGSIKYGSGAIGGTIHLHTKLLFEEHLSNAFVSSVGSYQTYQNLYKFSYGTTVFSLKIGAEVNQSENDYTWLGTEYKNENGAYQNSNFNVSAGYKISETSVFSLFLTKYNAERHFSGELPDPSKANEKYKDFNQRNLLVYETKYKQLEHVFKAGYLTQEYHYFSDKDNPNFDYGKSRTYLLNYDFLFKINSKSTLEFYSEYTSVFGSGNKIEEKNRKQFSQSGIFTQRFANSISYNLKLRKDFNSDFDMPLTGAFGVEIPLYTGILARMNGSTNYRVPTFNDLYWPGQGNLELIPENSKQVDVGIEIGEKNTIFEVDYFFIRTKDKITWVPGGDPNRPSIWVPINIASVENKGVELSGSHSFYIQEHLFRWNAHYSYVLAKDRDTNKFLIMTPKHLFTMNLGWTKGRWTAYYQLLYTGKVFTSEDNIDLYSIPSFDVSNIGVDCTVLSTKTSQLAFGVKVNNIFNEIYQTSPRRPMPNRNFNIQINYKF